MDSNTQPVTHINLKDLFFAVLKKSGIVLLSGLIIAVAAFCYEYASFTKDANVLDISTKIDGETDAEYYERILNVNRAEDIINSIDALNVQIDNQRKYVANSILMQIDSENEAVTTSTLVIMIDDSLAVGMDEALASSYSERLKTGEYLEMLAEDLGTEPSYLSELIKVEYNKDATSVVLNTTSDYGTAKSLTVTVIGPTTEYTDKIMNAVLEQASFASSNLSEALVPHTIISTGTQSYYSTDSTTRDLQYIAINRFETVQKQIGLFEDSLDEIASDLGVSGKETLYAYFSYDDESWNESNSAIKSATKMAIIGFVIGAVVVLLVLVAQYIFSKKFVTQGSFFARFPQVYKIGVAKPFYKRSRTAVIIDKIVGDDSRLPEEKNLKLMAANISNLTLGKSRVLFTGTAETERIKDLVAKLGVTADVKKSFFDDPTCLEALSNYDYVVIVEQRNHSEFRLIVDELDLINNATTKLIGAIII